MRRRWCRPRFLPAIAALLVLLWLLRPSKRSFDVASCDVGDHTRRAAVALAAKVSEILARHKVAHFVCYGTLWGALRINSLLPWERKVVLCAVNEDIREQDEVFFQRQFSAVGLSIEYRSSLGVYVVRPAPPSTEDVWVEVILFEEDDREQLDAEQPQLATVYLRRIGWTHRILPPGSTALHSFPKRLIDPPLSVMRIVDTPFAAPREGLELQKYHYPDDWWREIRPSNCQASKQKTTTKP